MQKIRLNGTTAQVALAAVRNSSASAGPLEQKVAMKLSGRLRVLVRKTKPKVALALNGVQPGTDDYEDRLTELSEEEGQEFPLEDAQLNFLRRCFFMSDFPLSSAPAVTALERAIEGAVEFDIAEEPSDEPEKPDEPEAAAAGE